MLARVKERVDIIKRRIEKRKKNRLCIIVMSMKKRSGKSWKQ